MFNESISAASTSATDHKTLSLSIRASYSRSRFAAVSFFESSNPSNTYPRGKITAAAETGPANGPRPASSTPATHFRPRV